MMIQKKTIRPKGIVRNAATTDADDGNCEQIVNLRPEGGAWRVTGQKADALGGYKPDDGTLRKTFVHKLPEQDNLIVLRCTRYDTATIEWTRMDDNEDEDTTHTWQTLTTMEMDTDDTPRVMEVNFAANGRVLTINTPTLRHFVFDNGEYTACGNTTSKAPEMKYVVNGKYTNHGSEITQYEIGVRGRDNGGCCFREYMTDQFGLDLLTGNTQDSIGMDMGGQNCPKKWVDLRYDEDEKNRLMQSLAGQYDMMQNTDRWHREGWVLICSAWQMTDGTVTCHSEPVLVHLGCEDIDNDFVRNMGRHFDTERDLDVYYNRDKIAIRRFAANNISQTESTKATVDCHVRKQWVQRLSIARPAAPDMDKTVQKAVYYVSQPLSMYDFENADFDFLHTTYHYDILSATQGLIEGGESAKRYYRLSMRRSTTDKEGLPERLPTRQWMEEAVMYRAAEFDMTDAADTEDKTVDFGSLSLNEPLPMDSSGHTTYGCRGMATHCQRLHLWNVETTLGGTPVTNTTLPNCVAGWRFAYKDTVLTNEVTERNVVKNPAGHHYLKPQAQPGNDRVTVMATYRLDMNGKKVYHHRTLHARCAFADTRGRQMDILPIMVSFADIRADQCTLALQRQDGTWTTTTIGMHPSKTMNMAFGLTMVDDKDATSLSSPMTRATDNPIDDSDAQKMAQADNTSSATPLPDGQPATTVATNTMMVSVRNNPMVFRPQDTYTFDDKISAVCVSNSEISAAQDGQYPTMVFTDSGIWAMAMGNGDSMYGTQVPVSTLQNICNNVLACPHGIVFVTKMGVMMMNGRQVRNLSRVAMGQIVAGLNRDAAMEDAACNHTQELTIAGKYRHGANHNQTDGMAQLANKDACLGYDRTHDELIVGNHTLQCNCNYVYNFGDKAWYLTSATYYSMCGDTGVEKPDKVVKAKKCRLVRLDNEVFVTNEYGETTPRPVMLMTRPMTLGSDDYKTVVRTMVRGENLGNTSRLNGVYLLASNDLDTWHMVAGTHWNQNCTQVEMARSKWSWRFHVLMVCGDVTKGFGLTHTDMEVQING